MQPQAKAVVFVHIYPDGSERPISFVSHILTPSEQNYTVHGGYSQHAGCIASYILVYTSLHAVVQSELLSHDYQELSKLQELCLICC